MTAKKKCISIKYHVTECLEIITSYTDRQHTYNIEAFKIPWKTDHFEDEIATTLRASEKAFTTITFSLCKDPLSFNNTEDVHNTDSKAILSEVFNSQ